MKKVLYSVFLALFVLFPVSVFADGYVSVSPESLTIEQGSSKTFTITAYNAIGDVTINSNNSGVASVSTGEWGTGMVEEKQTKTGYVTVTGNSVGTTTITISIDAATFDGDDLSGQKQTITINVIEPASTPQPQQPENNLSTNHNIGSLIVDGYNLEKVDNNNYTLVVSNNVTSINVNATAEDSKANVSGVGTHELQVGENNIEIIVTSESGWQNKINIKVTRKDGYYLEDLNTILKDKKNKDIDIIISSDSKISSDNLNKIKENKKQVNFNYYDEEKKLVYSWIIDGKNIGKVSEFITTIKKESKNIESISKLTNYSDGLYLNFEHNGYLPKGTKIKIYVGDKFVDESLVNIYHYTKDKLEEIKKEVKVEDGYIEFNIEHCSEYFVTKSDLALLKKDKNSSINIFMILSIIEFIIIVVLVLIYFLKLKKDSNEPTNEDENIKFDNSLKQYDNIVESKHQEIFENKTENEFENIVTNEYIQPENFQNLNNLENNEKTNGNKELSNVDRLTQPEEQYKNNIY